jgi:hypothetical protein
MSQQVAKFRYTGVALPGNAAQVVLFDTVVNFPNMANAIPQCGMKRLDMDLAHDQAGTLIWYKTEARGLTSVFGAGSAATTVWTQIGTLAVAAPAAGVSDNFDFLVEEFTDFKLEWTNGATPQTVWVPSIALSDERVKGT